MAGNVILERMFNTQDCAVLVGLFLTSWDAIRLIRTCRNAVEMQQREEQSQIHYIDHKGVGVCAINGAVLMRKVQRYADCRGWEVTRSGYFRAPLLPECPVCSQEFNTWWHGFVRYKLCGELEGSIQMLSELNCPETEVPSDDSWMNLVDEADLEAAT